MISVTSNAKAADDGSSAESLVAEARRLLGRHRPLDALNLAKRANANGGRNPTAAAVEAGALAAMYRFDEALGILVDLFEQTAESPQLVLAMIDLELGRGNPAQALELARTAASHFSDDVRFLMRQVAANKQLTREKSVFEGLQKAVELFPGHIPARMQLSDILRRNKDWEPLRFHLNKILEQQPGNLVATTYLEFVDGLSADELTARIGARAQEALKAAATQEERLGLLTEIGDRQLYVRRFHDALDSYREINDPASGDNRRLLNATRCHMQLANWDAAIELADRALEQAPMNVDALLLKGTAELARGNVDRYLDLFFQAEPAANRRHFRQYMALIFNLHALDRHDDAENLFKRWETLADQIPQLDLIFYYRRRQMEDKIHDYIATFKPYLGDSPVVSRMVEGEQERGPDADKSWNTREIVFGIGTPPPETVTSPEDLRILMGKTEQNVPENRNPILSASLGWAVCDDKSMGFDEWLLRIRRSAGVSRRLSQKPPRIRDTIEYVNPPDLAPLRSLLDDGKPFLLASSHMGPRVITVLSHYIPNLVYVTNGFKVIAEIPRIPFAQREPRLAAIKLVDCMRKGFPVLNMVDTPVELGQLAPVAGGGATGTIMGVPCTIPDVFPKLSQQLNVPTFFTQAYSDGDRIGIILERLPDPEPGERGGAWSDRWAQAYLDRLAAFMRTAPENQNLTAPMWRHLLLLGALKHLDAQIARDPVAGS